MLRASVLATISCSIILSPGLSAAALESGDILVTTFDMLVKVDPQSGDREVISGPSQAYACGGPGSLLACCTGPGVGVTPPCTAVGTGPSGILRGLCVEDSGDVVAVTQYSGLLRIDPDSGDRSVLSSSAVGTGPAFGDPRDVTARGDHLYVTDALFGAVFEVDRATGDRSVIAAAGIAKRCTSSGSPYACCTGSLTHDGSFPCGPVGSGAPITPKLEGIAVASNGDLLVTDSDTDAIIRLVPESGVRTVESASDATYKCAALDVPFGCCTGSQTSDGSFPCAEIGNGPAFDAPGYVATDSPDVYASVRDLSAVYAIDPDFGDRIVLSASDQSMDVCTGFGTPFSCCTGSGVGSGEIPCLDVGAGPGFIDPAGVAALDADNVYVSMPNSIMHIDGATGNRTVMSSGGADSCFRRRYPYDCCTGPGSGSGRPCDLVGTGSNLLDTGGYIHVVPEPAVHWLVLASTICIGVLRRR